MTSHPANRGARHHRQGISAEYFDSEVVDFLPRLPAAVYCARRWLAACPYADTQRRFHGDDLRRICDLWRARPQRPGDGDQFASNSNVAATQFRCCLCRAWRAPRAVRALRDHDSIPLMSSVGNLGHAECNRNKIRTDSMEILTMGNQLEILEAETLKLTSSERAAFTQVLLESFDKDAELEEAWAAEI